MEALVKKRENFQKGKNGFEHLSGNNNGAATESLTDSNAESRETKISSRSSSEALTEDAKTKGPSSPASLCLPILNAHVCKILDADVGEDKLKSNEDDSSKFINTENQTEIDMMKERFAKLLLGEDMSGSGKGVCIALALSNAITNLCATVFGQLWRLEPLPSQKKAMWRREMGWLLCLSDHIVELIPNWQTFPDGTKLEVMSCRPRSDLFINLPALRKLDNMLIEILDSYTSAEFWYIDQGVIAPDADYSASFCKTIHRQDEKWWLPVPRVSAGGLSDNSRKQLHNTRECTSQILKAAMAINSITLSEMEVPESFLEGLPKNGRACLGDIIYRYITSDQFSCDCLLDCLDLSSEHVALEVANRIEASIYVWRRRAHSKPPTYSNRSTTKSSWDMVKDLMVDVDKRELLAERAESLLLSLKQRFPCLTQTTLDTSKIHFNKDVGKSIIESYSRVLESLAFNVVARIDDVLYVDDLTKHSEKMSPVSKVSVITHKKVSLPFSVPLSSTTPYKTASTTPSFSPAPLISPAKVERTPFLHNYNDHKPPSRGFGVKRVLTNYLSFETKPKICGNQTTEGCASTPKTDTVERTPEGFIIPSKWDEHTSKGS